MVKTLRNPAFLLAVALFLVVVFGRQIGRGLVLVLVAFLVFGGGAKLLSRAAGRGRKNRAKTRKARAVAARREENADAARALRMHRAELTAQAKERDRIELAARREAGKRAARIGAGLDPDTGRAPGAPAPAPRKAAPRKAAPRKTTPKRPAR